jgi:hypothetical protein
LQAGVVVVAAAGNGDSNGNGQDADGVSFWPCYVASFCIGALNPYPDPKGYFTETTGFSTQYSNYGSVVSFWAPTNIHAMPDGATQGAALTIHTGTSASTPYVAGVIALMRSVNPSLNPQQILQVLQLTAVPLQVHSPIGGPQNGVVISPYDAVVAAGDSGYAPPQLVITAPKEGAVIGQTPFQAVTFTAEVVDPTVEAWPPPGPSGYIDNPVRWKSDLDGDLGVGSSIDHVFSQAAKTGVRKITATVTDSLGFKATSTIAVDYEPLIASPGVSIVYPPKGSTFAAGTIVVRGQANSAVSLAYVPCSKMVWQQGIADHPISSTVFEGAESGLCQAEVPFQAGSNQKVKLTATDVTGKSRSTEESIKIKPPSTETTVSIDSPTEHESYDTYPVNQQPVDIDLHAFVLNAPSDPVKYTWSWYETASGAASKIVVGTGQSQTLKTRACGEIAVEVEVASPSIPSGQDPKASTKVQINCESSQ